VGAGDAFVLQLLGGRFWDVRDCLPVQPSGVLHASQIRDRDTHPPPVGSLGVESAEFLDACVPSAFEAHNDARGFLLLEQALQVLQQCKKTEPITRFDFFGRRQKRQRVCAG
jgi:hypothetical protein